MNRIKMYINPSMQHSMCEDLIPELSRDKNYEPSDAYPNNHVPDPSGERCQHSFKASKANNERVVRSLLPINSLHRYKLACRKAFEEKPSSMVRRANQEEAWVSRTDVNREGCVKEVETTQRWHYCATKSVRCL